MSRLSDKKITVLILDDINQSIQRYMFMLLSIPLTVIVKVVTQHVEQLQPVAELLGD